MDKIQIAKTATNIVVGAGTSKIVNTIVKNNVQTENVREIITVNSAVFVLSSMVVNETRKYTDAKIEKIAAWVKKTKTQIDEAQK